MSKIRNPENTKKLKQVLEAIPSLGDTRTLEEVNIEKVNFPVDERALAQTNHPRVIKFYPDQALACPLMFKR
jgi:hypothetical protein